MTVAPEVFNDVELKPVEPEDLPAIVEGNWTSLAPFYDPIEPPSRRPAHDTRVRRSAHRLLTLLRSPHTLCTKAVLASGPEAGKLVGVALWQRPEAPLFNLKRRVLADETDEDREAWDGVDSDAWEEVWGGWDQVREAIMKGRAHWYIAPLWVLPAYKNRGIGRRLMQQVIDLCDAHDPPTPIYLEASPEGQRLYEKLGFVVEGTSAYKEMVRWRSVQKGGGRGAE
ncbi:hypothetical protein JCM21900_004942 [Sporobolomyces salmonicolor]